MGFCTGSKVTDLHVRKSTGCSGGNRWGHLKAGGQEEAAAGIQGSLTSGLDLAGRMGWRDTDVD